MSFLTATNTELIYSMPVAGADVGTASVASIVTGNTATNPAAYLPPLYSIWQPSTVVGKGFHIKLAGTYDATAVGLTFAYAHNTTQATMATTKVASTGSYTLTSATDGRWEALIDITCYQAGQSGVNVPAVLCNVSGTFTIGHANNAATVAAATLLLGLSSTGAPASYSMSPITAYYWEASLFPAASGVHFYCDQHEIFGLN